MSQWILLRGLMREQRHWGNFLAQFQQGFPEQTVRCLDFNGNGALHQSDSASSVRAMLEDVRAQLKQLGQLPPYRILSLSLGGMVTLEWARLYPAELEFCIIMNTSVAPYSKFYQRLKIANYPSLLQLFMQRSTLHREQIILRITSNLQRNNQALLEQWISYANQCPISRQNILRQLWSAFKYRAALTAPAVKILFLASEQDQLVDVVCSKTLARQWQCPIRFHPSAGHDLSLDDAPWVIQTIADWIRSLSPNETT